MYNYTVYCDGAYSPNRNQSGAGLVVYREDIPIYTFRKTFKGGSNNTAEICAIILGLNCFKNKVNSIHIISDSQYCIGIINKGWKINSNKLLWNEFYRVYDKTKELCNNIKFSWIRGHMGTEGQEQSDYLAVKASQAYERYVT